MHINSNIDQVLLFPDGAEISRVASIELPAGDHEVLLRGLPEHLDDATLRVEGEGDAPLTIGSVDVTRQYIEPLDEGERARLRQELNERQDELRALEARIETAKTQKQLMQTWQTVRCTRQKTGASVTGRLCSISLANGSVTPIPP
jgi:hypothetical protein